MKPSAALKVGEVDPIVWPKFRRFFEWCGGLSRRRPEGRHSPRVLEKSQRVRMHPPEFSLAAEMRSRIVEYESRYRCILELHKVFRAVLSHPLKDGKIALDVCELYPPVVDFADSCFCGKLRGIAEVDVASGDYDSFVATAMIMGAFIREQLLPKHLGRKAYEKGSLWEAHELSETVRGLLWTAWCLFDHPLQDELADQMRVTIDLIEQDIDWKLWHAIGKRLTLRVTRWDAEFARALAQKAGVNVGPEPGAIQNEIPGELHPGEARTNSRPEAPAYAKLARPVSEAGRRLSDLKDQTGLTWRKIAEESGVAERQLYAIVGEGAVPNAQTKTLLREYFVGILKHPIVL